jgi:hypothetical protein
MMDMGQDSCTGCTGKRKMVFYNTTTQEYTALRSVVVDKRCNGFTVNNAGTTIVTVNGEPLQPGDTKTVGGNEGEVYVGRIDLAFYTPTPAPSIIVNSAWVTQKFYESDNFIQ